jgi:gluconate 5-dehydrogenase
MLAMPSSLPHLFDLTGRTALVTGSTRGIGLALARGLGRAGAQVIVHGRDPLQAETVAGSLRDEGIAAGSRAFDLADPDAISTGIAAVRAEFGDIHVLVNNAGFIERGPLADFDLATWREMFAVNVTSAMLTAREVVPEMIDRGEGKIINICSVLSEVARPDAGAYATTKAALKMLTRSMCAEWAPHGIQANAIGPGYVKTELNTTLQSGSFDTWVTARTPAGRWGEPADLEGAVVFLAAPASDFVNGHVLYVDGGLLAVV